MFWINLFLMILLIAGHTELLVTMVNRVHALRLPCRFLRNVRHLHDVLIPTFPLVFFWFMGIKGAGLLTGGSWGNVSTVWMVYLTICSFGTVGLIGCSLVRGLRRNPQALLSNHSVIIDVEKRLGYRPLGEGPFRFLTKFPGNEIFKVEVAEKSFQLQRLPREWDGLSILHLSDFHFIGTLDRPYFEEITKLAAELQPDLILFTGDLLDDSKLAEWLPTTLGQLQAPLGCYFILGNHDWYLDPKEIRRCMQELGWQDVAGRTVTVEHQGQSIVIGGTERPWLGEHPDFSSAPEDAFRLLLSHTPDNLAWAKQQNIDLMLSGHNHGGQVVLPLFGPVYSPSVYGCRYASGLFWEEPTLLYVSRGISGRHPLRLRCLPEITKLTLNSPVEISVTQTGNARLQVSLTS